MPSPPILTTRVQSGAAGTLDAANLLTTPGTRTYLTGTDVEACLDQTDAELVTLAAASPATIYQGAMSLADQTGGVMRATIALQDSGGAPVAAAVQFELKVYSVTAGAIAAVIGDPIQMIWDGVAPTAGTVEYGQDAGRHFATTSAAGSLVFDLTSAGGSGDFLVVAQPVAVPGVVTTATVTLA